MQFLILAAGKPALGYAREGVELYLNRLKPFGKTELKLVKDGSSKDDAALSSYAAQATTWILATSTASVLSAAARLPGCGDASALVCVKDRIRVKRNKTRCIGV